MKGRTGLNKTSLTPLTSATQRNASHIDILNVLIAIFKKKKQVKFILMTQSRGVLKVEGLMGLENQPVLSEAVYFDSVCVRENGKRPITSAQTQLGPPEFLPGVLHQMVLLISWSAQRQPEGDWSRKELPDPQL